MRPNPPNLVSSLELDSIMKTRHLLAGTVLVLGTLAPSQATYTTFGTGCAGSGGGSVCASANPNTTAHRNLQQNTNIFALGVPSTSSIQLVTGFELFTQTYNRTTPLTINTEIYYADTQGAPTGSPVATGTMTIGTTAGWYRTTFSKLLIVPKDQKFFLSYVSAAGQMYFPIASSGTTTSHFYHTSTSTSWIGTPPNGFVTQYWAWKVICAGGSSTPALSNTGVPTLGKTFTVDLANARANARAIFVVGLSNTLWQSSKLPLDLTMFGAPGCNLYASLDLQLPVQADGNGKYSLSLPVPSDTSLKGFKFYNQYGVFDTGANPMGVAFSNAGAGVAN